MTKPGLNTEHNEQIAQLWNSGKNAVEIAEIVNLPSRVIYYQIVRMRKAGIKLKSYFDREPVRTPSSIKLKSMKKRYEPKNIYIPIKTNETAYEAIAPLPNLTEQGRWVSFIATGNKACRYTENGKTFCNAEGFPYCEEHRKMLFIPNTYKSLPRLF